ESVEHDQERVDLAQVAEQLRPRAAHLHDPDRRGRDLTRPDHLPDPRQARVGDRSHADVTGCTRARQGVEQRRLPGARKPHDPDLERHYDVFEICFCNDTSARCWSDFTAPSVLPRMVATSAFGKLNTNFSVSTCCCSCERFSISSSMLWRPIDCSASASAEGSSSPCGSGTSSSGCQRRFARK